ncbi:acetaldehyde dehydrogenase 7 [Striga asiatica]|uniref:Acetaldehyde dehydrogenase 7 n=1 Tax=Striga asiatica TaxID=4170 RepID=A0A5A7Q9J9_STRAF|nr:acetaldehyde dehydrogenase 7 [Striga asiatica]
MSPSTSNIVIDIRAIPNQRPSHQFPLLVVQIKILARSRINGPYHLALHVTTLEYVLPFIRHTNRNVPESDVGHGYLHTPLDADGHTDPLAVNRFVADVSQHREGPGIVAPVRVLVVVRLYHNAHPNVVERPEAHILLWPANPNLFDKDKLSCALSVSILGRTGEVSKTGNHNKVNKSDQCLISLRSFSNLIEALQLIGLAINASHEFISESKPHQSRDLKP